MIARRLNRILLVASMVAVMDPAPARAQQEDYERPPILYSKTAPNDAVGRIQQRIKSGEFRFPESDDRSILLALLKEMKIPVESQILVFSKTSKQRALIGPSRPRALYFSDDCYVGWVPGGAMEVVAFDPSLGPTFYLVDPHDSEQPMKFTRSDDCLSCHARSTTGDVPGLLARSVFPDKRGEPIFSAGSTFVTQETPFSERWGGWYVTGRHGAGRHRGNAIATESKNGADLDVEPGANQTQLDAFFDPSTYPLDQSDIVALMVFEHQVGAHNALNEANLQTRIALHRWRGIREALKEDPDQPLYGSTLSVIKHQADKILMQLLFVDEAALPNGGIQGATNFQTAFAATKRTDSKGRSLRDLDLQTRLFRYRCSYLVYSEAFDGLPEFLRNQVLDRLDEILTAQSPTAPFDRLPFAERKAIREILVETKPELAKRWNKPGA
jgi:hypothetical protein